MEHKTTEKKRHKSIAIWVFVATLSALLLSQLAGTYIANIFVGLFSVLMPILLGAFIAYLLKKLVTILEEKTFAKLFEKTKKPKVFRRTLSLCVIFFILLLIIVFFLVITVPMMINLIADLVNNSGSYIDKVSYELTQFFNSIELLRSLDLQTKINEAIFDFSVSIESYLPVLLENAVKFASDTTLIILNVLLSFVLAFLMLKDKEKISDYFKRVIYANTKTYRADNIIKVAKKTDEILYSYFIGKCIEAAIIFVLVSIGFLIINVPYAFTLAGIIALFNFIPYVGAVIGAVPALVLTIIFASVNTAVIALIYAIIVIILITSFVSPVIFGKKLNVSALLIILSIIIGGGMFGVLGMLLAPPIVAVLAVVLEEFIREKEELKLIIKSHGLTEDDLKEDEVLIEATKLTLEKKNQEKKPE